MAWARVDAQDVITGRRTTRRAEGPMGAGTVWPEARDMPRSRHHPEGVRTGTEQRRRWERIGLLSREGFECQAEGSDLSRSRGQKTKQDKSSLWC